MGFIGVEGCLRMRCGLALLVLVIRCGFVLLR